MCGIVGIVTHGSLVDEDLEMFAQMLFKCSSLGRDATGMYNSEKYYIKSPVISTKFLEDDNVQDFIFKSKGLKYIVGHCRAATRGSPKINENNHPLVDEQGRFLLVHNGMLECAKYDYYPHMTDTYIIVNAISHYLKPGVPLYDAVCLGQKDVMGCDAKFTRTGWKYYISRSFQSSMIVVGDERYLVLSRSDGPTSVYTKRMKDRDVFVFSTAPYIIGLKYGEISREIPLKVTAVFDFALGTIKYYNLDDYRLPEDETVGKEKDGRRFSRKK